MSVRSIIDIELSGAKEFERFQACFQKYQDALSKTPKAWREVAQSQKPSEASFTEMAAGMLAQNRMLRAYPSGTSIARPHWHIANTTKAFRRVSTSSRVVGLSSFVTYQVGWWRCIA